ncbi:hypothetical protein PFICI_04325 [Pestalotiopsis fici W106-1]|uniref:Uncharacterized protein n=1 Tax=Pestalotiopsis fici (strain W106-1 / CGMCC3.15140) TaxID=1229662 RepID=W3X8U5_PESFW|nr:uncharacterized protein PFICI_04325 [Pestalotiopsis fici W106-1]ETS82449.1 hypothetical protein PFICI_04325 [Pestalotiopsis fici W106-1]
MGNQEDTQQHVVDTEHMRESPPEHTKGAAPTEVVELPTRLSLYRSAHGLGNHYVIGEHREDPLLAVTTHSGFGRAPDVVLHSGPAKDSAMLAGVDSNVLVHSTTAKLRLPGSPTATEEKTVEIAQQGGAHRFVVQDESRQPVTFEWLPHAETKTSLLGDSRVLHWELVRYAGTGAGKDGAEVQSDEDKQVVATWANESSMSLSKVLSLEFLVDATRITTRDSWVVMALITALRIWDSNTKSVSNKQRMS